MEKKKFHYLSYDIKLGDVLASYTEGDCIVCQNEQLTSILEAQLYSKKIFQKRPKVVSLESFLSSICLTEKTVLKDLHRIFSLYQILKEEDKRKWNIKTYFDFVDIANEFFSFYEEYIGMEESIEENILLWQREKFLFFQKMKTAFDEKLEREQSIPKDWLYRKEYYDSYYAKTFTRIVFLDIISFSRAFLEISNLLEKDCKLEFVLQMRREDFEEERLKLRQCSLEQFSGKFSAYQIGSDWEEALFLLAEKEKTPKGLYSSHAKEKHFYTMFPSSFINPQKNTFDESNLYRFMEIQLELFRQKEEDWKEQLPLESVILAIQKRSLRDYYGFWEEDVILLRKLLAEEFRYFSIHLLEHPSYRKILGEGEEFYRKITLFLEDLWAIEACQEISDIYQYFERRIVLEKFKEEAYPDVLDLFYEVLARLSNYEKNKNFGSYKNYFDGNIGRNLYQLLFRSLHHIYLKSAEEFVQDKLEVRDWHSLAYEKEKERQAIFLDVDDKSLPNITEKIRFLTENQRFCLGLKTREECVLEEKYRFYQALSSQKDIVFLIRKSEKENKTVSSFVEEWLWKQGGGIKKNPYSKEFFLASLQRTFASIVSWDRREEKVSFLEKDNHELIREGKFVLGAYDWQQLQDCEKRFYFSKVLEERKKSEFLSFGLSPRVLGSICHRFLERIGKLEWKGFLKTGTFSIEKQSLEKYLKEEFQKENVRLPNFLGKYLEEIIIPKIVKNTLFFLDSIEKKYKGQKIKRFQGEKDFVKEGIYHGEDLQVSFHGRADLIVETNFVKEIIDYKTGKISEDQLDFYAFLLYGEEEKIEGRYYNLWNGVFTTGKRKEVFREETLAEFFENFEKQQQYHIAKKKGVCQYCSYTKICLREEEECQD